MAGRGSGQENERRDMDQLGEQESEYSSESANEHAEPSHVAGRRASRVKLEWQAIDPATDSEAHSFHFSQASGPKLSLGSDAQPYDFYVHFLGDNFLSMIVSGTNEYA